MATVSYPHIELSADGVPYLERPRTKVIEIALDSLAHHWGAEEIQRQHPHLTMGQIHAALAYFHDHREALDAFFMLDIRSIQTVSSAVFCCL